MSRDSGIACSAWLPSRLDRDNLLGGGERLADKHGNGLIVAGAIVTFIGLCIVLIKVLRIPSYWVPVMVGLGLLLAGLIRRFNRRD